MIGAPPEWVGVMYAAKWMGVGPWDLIAQDELWTEWARLLMRVEHKGQERTNAKAGKKRGA
ncbi:MAG: hypothetical protein M3451_13665 [Chloroflexota bacterium]|nr:hypothetical protein [Chloroflexota bacterium]